MVIIVDMPGQLGNKLFEFSNIIANSIENKYTLINFGFSEYEKYFDSTLNSQFGKNEIYTIIYKQHARLSSFLKKLILRITIRWTKNGFMNSFFHTIIIVNNYIMGESYKLNDPKFIYLAKSKIVLLSGTWYTDLENFNKHSNIIRSFFKPHHHYADLINQNIQIIKVDKTILIGVHIRKGDYINFLDGIYFFSNEVYLDKMRKVSKLFIDPGIKLSFLICSNEPIDLNYFSEFDVKASNQESIVDLYSLSKCDYLLGVMSTFVLWASFYGNVPYLQIKKDQPHILLSDFHVIKYS